MLFYKKYAMTLAFIVCKIMIQIKNLNDEIKLTIMKLIAIAP